MSEERTYFGIVLTNSPLDRHLLARAILRDAVAKMDALYLLQRLIECPEHFSGSAIHAMPKCTRCGIVWGVLRTMVECNANWQFYHEHMKEKHNVKNPLTTKEV